jgi:cell division protein ZapB
LRQSYTFESTVATMSTLAELAERVERLLLRHDELQRTSLLMQQQLESLTQERDGLRSRLSAARARVETLIARLPHEEGENGTSSKAHVSPGDSE